MVRGCTISRVVSHAAMDIIFRGTYHAPQRLLLSSVVSYAATDAWTDMRVCIVKKDMHHYILTLDLMALHILLLMNLNTCFTDLAIVSL